MCVIIAVWKLYRLIRVKIRWRRYQCRTRLVSAPRDAGSLFACEPALRRQGKQHELTLVSERRAAYLFSPPVATNKFPAQAEIIERVRAILNLSNEALAVEVAVRPETMQKYAAGYQKAGDKLMRIISRLPEIRQGNGSAAPHRLEQSVAGAFSSVHAGVPSANGALPRDVKLDPPSTQQQLGIVLKEGTLDEVRLLRQVVETIFRQIEIRRQPAPVHSASGRGGRGPLVFDGRPRLLPALGYIPAGWPQETVAQQASQFVVVPADEFPEADYVLKVQGDSMVDADIHHGDWVVMTTRREPRAGSIVAALVDNATTLKTYRLDERQTPFLRSENKAYPPSIIPREEMQVQGVMLGKLGDKSAAAADRNGSGAPAPF